MRALTGLLILAAFAAVPASARAQEPMCTFGPYDANATQAFQDRVRTVVNPSSEYGRGGVGATSVEDALGAQYTMLWLDNARLGWTVAFSPGPHDAASARAAIRGLLATRTDAATADFLDSTLLLVPTPYSRAELNAVSAQISELVRAHTGLFSMFGIGCAWSDGVRVQVSVGTPDTPERRAEAEALLAPFGDKVRVEYGAAWVGPAPGVAEQRPTLKVRDHVSLPRTSRCARTVTAKPRGGAGVKRVRLAIGKRVSAGKTARLKLKSKRSKVTVTVTLSDNSVAIETLTYRRC